MILISYRSSKAKILRSIKGVSPDETLQTPIRLLRSIKLIYISLSLIVFDNLITHLWAIFNENGSYISVGAASMFSLIAAFTFIIGISLFYDEVIRIPPSLKNSKIRYIFNSNYIIIFVFTITLILRGSGFSIAVISNWIIFLAGLMIFSFILETYLINQVNITNSVDKLRIHLSGFLSLGLVLVLFLGLSFIPTSRPPETWPTRTIHVEILIFGVDIWVLWTTGFIHLIILLPRKLRIMFNIEDEEFYMFRDETMDYDWSGSYWPAIYIQDNKRTKDLNPDIKQFENYILISNIFTQSPHISQIKEFAKKLGISNIYSPSVCDESYFKNYIKNKSNLIFLITNTDNQVSKFVTQIQEEYEIHLDIDEQLKINNFEYSMENHSFTSISIVPAYWNFNKKIWILLSKENNLKEFINFIIKYHNFFDLISNEEPIFSVQKFDMDNHQNLKPINPDPSNPNIPDYRHLIFL